MMYPISIHIIKPAGAPSGVPSVPAPERKGLNAVKAEYEDSYQQALRLGWIIESDEYARQHADMVATLDRPEESTFYCGKCKQHLPISEFSTHTC